jgi:hypothetical protein
MLEDAATLSDAALPRVANQAACLRYIDRYLRSEAATEVEQWSELIGFVLRHPLGPAPC